MNLATALEWLAEEGIQAHPVDAEGYAWVHHIELADTGLLIAHREGRPFWVLETRFEVHYDGEVDAEIEKHLKHHLTCTFLAQPPRVRVESIEGGLAATFTRHIYPECMDRQRFMDEFWVMRNHGLAVSAETDRLLLAL